jgi:hypothetical protein
MKEETTTKAQTKTVNQEALRMLACEIVLNEASRKLDVPVNTGKSWARRGGWKLPARPGGRPARTLSATSLHPIAGVLVETHQELENKTKTGLATAAANAAEHAQSLDGASTFGQSNKLRDLAASAARIFGWDKGPQTNVQVNTLRITQQQLAEIRALRDAEALP